MKALLDTHVLLWFTKGDARLSANARRFIASTDRELYFSVASAIEISIKYTLAKLTLPSPPQLFVRQVVQELGLQVIPIALEHALLIAELPLHHRDPVDRMLIAQSISQGLPIVTSDAAFERYDVELIW